MKVNTAPVGTVVNVGISRQVVVALKGGANSGKTGALRKLYNDMIAQGAVCVAKDRWMTKNLRRSLLVYKRWVVVICEGGDTDKIIRENFDWADEVCRDRLCSWDVIVMPAWIHMNLDAVRQDQSCVSALLEEVWKKTYSLEIVDRKPVPKHESDKAKTISQRECAKRLKRCIDFVVCDRFMY